MEINFHTNEQILSAAKEAAVWCQLQWNASEPRSSLRTLNFLPCFFNTDQYYTVNDLIYSRKYEMERLGLKPSSNLSMGKILVYEPDSNISDCISEGETSGYFDSSDCPPWDTWVGFIVENNQRYVLSWVPNEIIHIVEAGFEVNCVECFYWLESSSESWALKLKNA